MIFLLERSALREFTRGAGRRRPGGSMKVQPWQALQGSDHVIAIFDAAHAVEEEELDRCLNAGLQEHGVEGEVHRCVLPLSLAIPQPR
ncbi:MAG: hypothetical protein AAGL66_16120, partial [Pseudomonadota bacterium]